MLTEPGKQLALHQTTHAGTCRQPVCLHACLLKQPLLVLCWCVLQYSWPEFVAADLSQTTLMDALSTTTWNKTKRTMFIIEGLVSRLTVALTVEQPG